MSEEIKCEPEKIDDLIAAEFYEWWEKEWCLVRTGGGDYERTFAFAAYRKLMPEVFAAREAKKTPVWTKADQQAGKLPDVGAILKPIAANPSEFIGVDIKDNHTWWFRYNGGIFSCLKSRCEPIETEAERQQREAEMLVLKAERLVQPRLITAEYNCGLRDAIMLFMSGELKMPEVRNDQ